MAAQQPDDAGAAASHAHLSSIIESQAVLIEALVNSRIDGTNAAAALEKSFSTPSTPLPRTHAGAHAKTDADFDSMLSPSASLSNMASSPSAPLSPTPLDPAAQVSMLHHYRHMLANATRERDALAVQLQAALVSLEERASTLPDLSDKGVNRKQTGTPNALMTPAASASSESGGTADRKHLFSAELKRLQASLQTMTVERGELVAESRRLANALEAAMDERDTLRSELRATTDRLLNTRAQAQRYAQQLQDCDVRVAVAEERLDLARVAHADLQQLLERQRELAQTGARAAERVEALEAFEAEFTQLWRAEIANRQAWADAQHQQHQQQSPTIVTKPNEVAQFDTMRLASPPGSPARVARLASTPAPSSPPRSGKHRGAHGSTDQGSQRKGRPVSSPQSSPHAAASVRSPAPTPSRPQSSNAPPSNLYFKSDRGVDSTPPQSPLRHSSSNAAVPTALRGGHTSPPPSGSPQHRSAAAADLYASSPSLQRSSLALPASPSIATPHGGAARQIHPFSAGGAVTPLQGGGTQGSGASLARTISVRKLGFAAAAQPALASPLHAVLSSSSSAAAIPVVASAQSSSSTSSSASSSSSAADADRAMRRSISAALLHSLASTSTVALLPPESGAGENGDDHSGGARNGNGGNALDHAAALAFLSPSSTALDANAAARYFASTTASSAAVAHQSVVPALRLATPNALPPSPALPSSSPQQQQPQQRTRPQQQQQSNHAAALSSCAAEFSSVQSMLGPLALLPGNAHVR